MAGGDLILFLDSDDLLSPACLTSRVSTICEDRQLDFVVALTSVFENARQIDSIDCLKYQWTDESDLLRFLQFDEAWQTGGVLWRRSVFDKIGDWNTSLGYYQDWKFHCVHSRMS